MSSLRVVKESFTLELRTTGRQGRFLFASHVLVLLWMTGQEGIYCTALSNIPFLLASIMKLCLDSMLSSGYSGFPLLHSFYLMENVLEFIYSTILCYIFIDLF